MNSSGHSDYNMPAYVHLFMREQITVCQKKVFLGLQFEFYSFFFNYGFFKPNYNICNK